MNESIIEKDYRKLKEFVGEILKTIWRGVPYLFRVFLAMMISAFIIKGYNIKQTVVFYGFINIQLILMAIIVYLLFWVFHKTYWVENELKKVEI